MILADKIIELRKRNGWSQEQLGEQLNVSRQAVSKWEMALTTPDISKIMAMSRLFGVSTDFLLKEEYDLSSLEKEREYPEATEITDEEAPAAPAISEEKSFIALEEVQKYLTARQDAAKSLVTAVFLFFVSPFAGIFLSIIDEKKAVIGLVIQLIILIITSITVILAIARLSEFRHLKKPDSELAYGVRGMIEKTREQFRHTHLMGIIIGTICIIGGVLPMMIVSAFTSFNNIAIAVCGCIMLLIFASGISSILYVQFIDGGYKKILKMK